MPETAQKLANRAIEQLHASRSVPPRMQTSCVWLHNIRSMHNVGSVFRTCDAFGMGTLLLSGFTPIPPRPEISKAALGADEFVTWRYIESVPDVLSFLKERKCTLFAVEQTTASIPIFELRSPNLPENVCFLFGNEVQGVDPDLVAAAKVCVEIPQYGRKHSLNVSVSAGIVLFQYLSALLHHE